MIETTQSIVIAAPIAKVWAHAHDIRGWSKLMPGLQDCEIIDDNVSHWTLKVGIGALVRTVKVSVHVDRWAGPDQVDFTYKLNNDPVNGGGTYRARSLGPQLTEIALGIRVIGEGPMAPMWEAMGKPLLPKFARAFAEQFKAEIEQAAGRVAAPDSTMPTSRASFVSRLLAWLRRRFGSAPAA